ncbi:dihydroneopterin aldolase [Bradyrhizobium sp. WSM3983]|uniref:dihydroneopterin aldolase n=1 Tax=Bradyrhizobium sp. WSM3983 TaxID=1038867 RepID=UPI000686B5F3|nr:dihydroneopterin aldolase [Bradyrhizobium sp. WSM3983]
MCVSDLRLMALVGVHSHEIERSQPIIVSVELSLIGEAPEALCDTIDYRQIIQVAEALSKMHIPLIETFADRLGRACIEWNGVEQARVKIVKPHALEKGIASIEVTIRREDEMTL